MTKFNTLDELVKAYQKEYNNSYNNDPDKMFSYQDVIDVCVTILLPLAARAKGIQIAKISSQIDGFGYVHT